MVNVSLNRNLDSSKWNFKLRRDLGADVAAEGVFYMSFKDFLKGMTGFDICYYEENFEHSSIKMLSDPQKPTLLNIKIPKSGQYYFSFH